MADDYICTPLPIHFRIPLESHELTTHPRPLLCGAALDCGGWGAIAHSDDILLEIVFDLQLVLFLSLLECYKFRKKVLRPFLVARAAF